jgi:DNA processing protein
MATMLSRDLALAGVVVVSGLAHGIDHAAHMAAPGRTIAVLGQGTEHAARSIRAKAIGAIVQAGGLVVSEFLPEHPAARWTFPQRNRIIAGISEATVVVEAGQRSGALITARHALDYGRSIFVVPGHPLEDSWGGSLRWLRDGATPIRHSQDLLDDLGWPSEPSPDLSQRLPAAQKTLLDAIGTGCSIDEMVLNLAWPLSRILTLLGELELHGRVERLPGDRYANPGHR